METIASSAVVLVHDGQIVFQWGETERPFNCHSIRKSIISALFGIHAADGTIELDRPLAKLGIDDKDPSLTPVEKTATVRDLLKARSGIYHAALYETTQMKALRPARGSHPPGEFWYYNNWDFNALGTIFQTETGRSFFEEFETRLAGPLQMQDFDRRRHTQFVTGDDSVHPAYPITLSARDLARFGLLFARNGRWHEKQIVPKAWVVESTRMHSDAGERGGYGYLWWVARDGLHFPGVAMPDGAFFGRGSGGQVLVVVPQWDLVVVHRVNTFERGRSVTAEEFAKLLELLLAAMPEAVRSRTSPAESGPPSKKESAFASAPISAATTAPEMKFDVLLKNGRIMDGTGNPWFAGDVGIRDRRIVAVGRLAGAEARRTIDVAGRVIAPGFIDLHSHAEGGLTSRDEERRSAPNLISQGITTVVVNQDGFGSSSIAKQLESFQKPGIGPNVIALIGHGGIRRVAMKDDFRRPATEAEVLHMRRLIRDAMHAGAFGLSAGLEYFPGRWSTKEEMRALVEEVAEFDGIYSVHERSSGADPMWYLPSRDGSSPHSMIDNIQELIDIGRTTGATVVATHIKARGETFWGASERIIHMIAEARRQGVRIFADQYPYNTSGSDGSIVLIPDWPATRVGGTKDATPAEVLEAALQVSDVAADLRRDIEHEIVRRGGPRQIIIMSHLDETLVGKSLHELAERFGISPVEMVIKLQLEGNRKSRGGARLRSYSMSEADVEAFMRQPWTATSSDAGIAATDSAATHPRFYGSFPRKIRHYALDRGVMTVEDAIRSSTSLPAEILGLRNRGLVREGCHADLVVLDLNRIRDTATADQPNRISEGIDFVLVVGEFVVDEGKPTRTLPGRVIRRHDPE